MEFIPCNICWLIPEEIAPCDIHVHFRGQYALALNAGQPISFDFLDKITKVKYSSVYIKSGSLKNWQDWIQTRHPKQQSKQEDSAKKEEEASRLYGNKRAEYLSFMQKAVSNKNESNSKLCKAFEEANKKIPILLKSPMLDWYFKKFHEPPDLFHHGARVTYPMTIFCLFYGLLNDKELDNLIYSSIIHELDGDPAESLKTVVSQQTLQHLEKTKHPVPGEVIDLIRCHDEFCSGKGFPNGLSKAQIPIGVRAFTIFNHFDHYRLKATGTRRARFETALKQMRERAADYDPDLWEKFNVFIVNSIEAIA